MVPGVEQVILASSGTEAVQAALRLARATTGRAKFIKFEGHYHGWMNNVLVSYRPKTSDPIAALPACGGQPACEFADTIVLPWNDLDAVAAAFAAHPEQIAAVITEPLLANSGSCVPREGYLQGLVDVCRRNGAISIFDEVITGFRLALGGAREHFGVIPDLSVYAKAIAGGFTLAAVGGRREVFDVLRDGRTIHAGTYNGHAVNIAAALATLEVLSEPGIYKRMDAHGRAIREALEKSATAHGHRLVTTGVGTVFRRISVWTSRRSITAPHCGRTQRSTIASERRCWPAACNCCRRAAGTSGRRTRRRSWVKCCRRSRRV